VIGLQPLIDSYAYDLHQRGLSQSEIRERIGDVRIAVGFTRGFKVASRNEVARFADQSVEVDD
jgi:hypothetical protein